jgi:pimeloyl-ACP methyl ester carboxylesterase
MLNRRQLLSGAAALAGVAVVGSASSGVRRRVHDLLDPVPEPSHPLPTGPAGSVVQGTLDSTAMGREIAFDIAYPAQVVRGIPVLLQLHGRGDDHSGALGSHHLGAYLSEVVRGGVPPFAVVAADGGDHSYWHPRADGTDPQRMLVAELLPRLAASGLNIRRFAVGGWSMGGYGAILLAETLGPRRVAAVVADSPAIVTRWEDSAGGSFDSAEDFAAHDVLAGASRLKGIPVRVSCGTSDPFLPGVREFLQRVPTAEIDLGTGGHNAAWWQHAAPGQLAFAGRALALG